MAHLAADCLGEVALAVRVFDQEHLALADDALLAVARRDLDRAIEVDDVLSARRGVPRIVVGARRLAEDDAGRLVGRRGLAAGAFVLPFHFDVSEMSFALFVDIEIMDAHGILPTWPVSAGSLERNRAQ